MQGFQLHVPWFSKHYRLTISVKGFQYHFLLTVYGFFFFSDYGKYEQSIETSTDPEDHDGVWKTGLIEILYENCTVNFF